MSRLKKIKARYIAAFTIIALSAAITPFSIDCAYKARGYVGYGGERLIIPMGCVMALAVLEVAKEIDYYRKRKEKDGEVL